MDIDTLITDLKQILTENYPNGVPENLTEIIKYEIKKQKSTSDHHITADIVHPHTGYKCKIDKGISKLIECMWSLGDRY